MKAAVIGQHGGSSEIHTQTLKKPISNDSEVLIKVYYAGLNHLDIFTRNGIPGIKLTMPHTLGADASGVVEHIGDNVPSSIKIGNKVVINPSDNCRACEFCNKGEESLCLRYQIRGEHITGTYQEYIAVPWEKVYVIPDDYPLDRAAAVPLAYMTAWRMLFTQADLKKGEKILIVGAGGGVATAAIQLAHSIGAEVYVTSTSKEKLEKAKKIGADHAILYESGFPYHKTIRKMTEGRGVDVVIDSVGEVTWNSSLKSLAKGGRLVSCGATSGPKVVSDMNFVFWNQIRIIGSTMASDKEFKQMMSYVIEKGIVPEIAKIFSLDDAKKAHDYLEGRHQFGKVLLKISD